MILTKNRLSRPLTVCSNGFSGARAGAVTMRRKRKVGKVSRDSDTHLAFMTASKQFFKGPLVAFALAAFMFLGVDSVSGQSMPGFRALRNRLSKRVFFLKLRAVRRLLTYSMATSTLSHRRSNVFHRCPCRRRISSRLKSSCVSGWSDNSMRHLIR